MKGKTAQKALATIAAALCLAIVAGCSGGGNNAPASSNSAVEESSLSSGATSASQAEVSAQPGEEDESVDDPTMIPYSWEELSQISKEISEAGEKALAELDDTYSEEDREVEIIAAGLRKAEEYGLWWNGGDSGYKSRKNVKLQDGQIATVEIIGFNQDVKADGSGRAGITFQFVDCVDSDQMNGTDTADGGWEASQMRSWLNTELLSSLPTDLQQAIVPVDKYTNNVGETSSRESITATQDKLWLLSAVEIGSSVRLGGYSLYDIYEQEAYIRLGQYLYFGDSGVNFALKDSKYDMLKKMLNGSSTSWWLRSPIPDSGDAFLAIGKKGGIVWGDPTTYVGVAPGFCI